MYYYCISWIEMFSCIILGQAVWIANGNIFLKQSLSQGIARRKCSNLIRRADEVLYASIALAMLS